MTRSAQRNAFLARLDDELGIDKDSLVVFRLDLDRFARIRRTFGSAVSRALRMVLAERIAGIIGPDGPLMIYAEDSFAGAVRVESADAETLEHLALGILRDITADVEFEGLPTISIGCNVGIAAAAHFGRVDALRLLTGADFAIQRANAFGSRRIIIYEVAAVADPTRLPGLFQGMLPGIHAGQFQPWFQPVVSLPDRRIVGAETLARWIHPTHGPLLPAEFVTEAEYSGLMRDIDRSVWKQATSVYSSPQVPTDLTLTVNVSPADLDFPDIVDTMARCLEETGLEPGRIVLEVTETALSQDWPRAKRRLEAFKSLGARIAVDDFGAGHMFLDRLSTDLFDLLKIDRTVVERAGAGNARADALLSAVVALGTSLGLRIVAEGVETEAQLAHVIEAGCERAQGFLFAEPRPAPEFLDLVNTTRTL